MSECRTAAYVAKEIQATAAAMLLKQVWSAHQMGWDEREGQFTWTAIDSERLHKTATERDWEGFMAP